MGMVLFSGSRPPYNPTSFAMRDVSMLSSLLNMLRAAPHRARIKDPQEVDRQFRYWRIRIMYSMYIGYAVFYFTRKSFTFAMPAMLQELPYTKADLGILASAFYITYGLSKFISGMISDRSNPRFFMAFGLMMTGVLNIVFAYSTSLLGLTIIWLLNGFFQGWGWPPCARLLTHWYSQRERGRWWGVWNTCHNLGGAIIPLIVAAAVAYGDWRLGMMIPGAIAIVMSLVLMNRLRDVPESEGLPTIEEYRNDFPVSQAELKEQTKTPMREILFNFVLNNKYIWMLCVAYAMIYIVRTAINDWGAVYLNSLGFSVPDADACLAFFEIGGFFGSLVAGFASDLLFNGRRGPINLIYSAGVLVATVIMWHMTSGGFMAFALIIGVFGFLIFGPQMLIGVAAAELSHREAAGTATGFLGFFGYLGAAIAGYPLGYITEQWDWTGFFLFVAVCAAIGIVVLMFLWSVSSFKHIHVEAEIAN